MASFNGDSSAAFSCTMISSGSRQRAAACIFDLSYTCMHSTMICKSNRLRVSAVIGCLPPIAASAASPPPAPPPFPWSARTMGLAINLQLSLFTVIDIAFWTSWPHHVRMSSIHLCTSRPGRIFPSTIPNTPMTYSSRSSGILQMAEQLKLSLSDGVHRCPLPLHLSSDLTSLLEMWSCQLTSSMPL